MNQPKNLYPLIVVAVICTLMLVGCGSPATPAPSPEPTITPTPSLVVGDWEAVITFKVGDAVNIVNFSFTVNEDGNQITGYGIADLGLGVGTSGTTSAGIVDGKFKINADTYAGTTKIGRVFEGIFVASDQVEGTFTFDYGPGKHYEGEWVGIPKSGD